MRPLEHGQSLPAPASPTVAPHDELRIRAPAPRGGPGWPLALLGVRRRPLASHTGPVALPGFRCTSSALQGFGGGQVTLSGAKGSLGSEGPRRGPVNLVGSPKVQVAPRVPSQGSEGALRLFQGSGGCSRSWRCPWLCEGPGCSSSSLPGVSRCPSAGPGVSRGSTGPGVSRGSSGPPGVSRGSSAPPRVSLLR